MDPQTYQTFLDVATVVTKLKMYPYFDVCNYVLMCLMVREDNHPQTTGSTLFSRKHPLSCWVSSMMLCFAGSIMANFLIGEPLITPFKSHQDLLTASIVWYIINYSPFDLVYKIVKWKPIKTVVYCLKEIQRTHKIHHAVAFAMKAYPGSYIIVVMIGVCKGSGSGFLRMMQRLVCGIFIPSHNEFLKPSFVTKGSLAATILFICERLGYIQAPHVLIYFGVVLFFIYFRLSSILLGIHDPFTPFENLFCAIFMGGMWDAMRRAMSREKVEDNANASKSRDEKKND